MTRLHDKIKDTRKTPAQYHNVLVAITLELLKPWLTQDDIDALQVSMLDGYAAILFDDASWGLSITAFDIDERTEARTADIRILWRDTTPDEFVDGGKTPIYSWYFSHPITFHFRDDESLAYAAKTNRRLFEHFLLQEKIEENFPRCYDDQGRFNFWHGEYAFIHIPTAEMFSSGLGNREVAAKLQGLVDGNYVPVSWLYERNSLVVVLHNKYFSDTDLGRIGISSPIPALNLRQKADGQGA